ncbi:GIY-YIG nuclease family protein [Marinirhabdus gelatinilytica]|uniref:Putative endonuclease n=1 Tax=Marinirhabdus gelatinilytica TaxID=1703343 RepID=A0A370QJ55_9FLAO|nr:GIY-YIG nuclease family protein [Marinirhabdus gelatinilytica]RDK88376.1 putative endonuclease [Marinirhabdus gelatinilytica]
MARGYFYILKCADDSYYVGSTQSVLKRVKEHLIGKGAVYTSKRLPLALVYFEEHHSKDSAYLREMQLKKWSRKKKEALILNWTEVLEKAAECQNKMHHKFHNQ